jgi:regulatory protein
MARSHAARRHLYLVTSPVSPAPEAAITAVPFGSAAMASPEPDPEPSGDAEAVARSLCLRALTKRAQTRKELADLLRAKGIPADVAGMVLDRFTAVGLVDDAALAAGYAESRHRTLGLSRSALRQKLRERGVAPETAEAAVSHIDLEAEATAALALARRKLATMKHVDAPTRARRLIAMLARKGYPASISQQVVRSLVAEVDLPEA